MFWQASETVRYECFMLCEPVKRKGTNAICCGESVKHYGTSVVCVKPHGTSVVLCDERAETVQCEYCLPW